MSSQITSDQAKFLLALALPIIKTEHETTKRVIEAIPLDKGDYRPEPVAKSALELAWHIVAAEHRFLGGICVGKFDFTPNNRPDSINNSARIATRSFDESFNANVKQIEGLTGEQLAQSVDFRGMFQMPGCELPYSLAEPHYPPSRPAFYLPEAHGWESPLDLW